MSYEVYEIKYSQIKGFSNDTIDCFEWPFTTDASLYILKRSNPSTYTAAIVLQDNTWETYTRRMQSLVLLSFCFKHCSHIKQPTYRKHTPMFYSESGHRSLVWCEQSFIWYFRIISGCAFWISILFSVRRTGFSSTACLSSFSSSLAHRGQTTNSQFFRFPSNMCRGWWSPVLCTINSGVGIIITVLLLWVLQL